MKISVLFENNSIPSNLNRDYLPISPNAIIFTLFLLNPSLTNISFSALHWKKTSVQIC